MSKFNCFSALVGKKKDKGGKSPSTTDDNNKKLNTLQVRLETNESKSTSFSVPVPFGISGNSRCKVKVMDHESPVKEEAIEVAYEGEDEQDSDLSMKRENSDFDLQSHVVDSNSETNQPIVENNAQFENTPEKGAEEGVGSIQSGNLSDPGIWKAEFWASPELKRSCSDLETREVFRKISDQLPPSKSESFEELQQLAERFREEEDSGSPKSVLSHYSADKVMLKKHSSSQVLPSRSRRLWWKLFLWSHRNLQPARSLKQQTASVAFALNQQGGYCSDTLEPNRSLELDVMESPENEDNQNWNGLQRGVSGFLPQNQWVAFSTESPLTRVDEWVKELATQPSLPANDEEEKDNDSRVVFPASPENGKSLARNTSQSARRQNLNLPEEILHANNVIRSLNSSSTVAHAMGIGLKVIPTLAHFSSLRSVNLSGNSIVHITSGSLPKGLNTLNLSRNKISTIEGFRELTRLRVLDLSYNRISRIGHGLSNCTLIKELYIAGNKISEVEGLHRLLKLTVLDLSFNKITTAKALGQLVANYNSLLALNLLGNPIQSNISDEQLRKATCSLLPKLAYLNKQPINPQKAREVSTESIAKAALGNSSRGSHRRTVKRVSQGGSVSSSLHRGGASATSGQTTKYRSRGRSSHNSDLNKKSAALASSFLF